VSAVVLAGAIEFTTEFKATKSLCSSEMRDTCGVGETATTFSFDVRASLRQMASISTSIESTLRRDHLCGADGYAMCLLLAKLWSKALNQMM